MTGRRRGAHRLGVAGALALLMGCAQEARPLLREDLDRLRGDIARSERALQKSQADLKAELQQSDLRIAQTLTEVQRSLGRIIARYDELSRDTAQMQSRLDELKRRVDLLAGQLDSTGARGAASATPPPSGGAQPAAGGAPGTGFASPVAAAPAAPVAGAPPPGTQASDLYQTAYIDYTRGNYTLAIAAFKEFIRLYPTSELAENAQYWVGESHFSIARGLQSRGDRDRAIGEFERAAREFRQVTITYPRGKRVPAGLYKEALALLELSQSALAEARLRVLVDQYPSTEEAAKATEELVRIRKR